MSVGMLYWDITFGGDMHSSSLRKVGGSVMMAVPPAVLELLQMRAGDKLSLSVEDGRIVVHPQPRPT
jgi:antitoxin ChpS